VIEEESVCVPLGGGQMNNPSRYLTLLLPINACRRQLASLGMAFSGQRQSIRPVGLEHFTRMYRGVLKGHGFSRAAKAAKSAGP
jgi:hypothetical protein